MIRQNRRVFLAGLVGAACVSGGVRAQSGRPQPVPAHRRPMFIECAALHVENLPGMLLFYQQVVGLEVMRQTENGALLGIGGTSLIELERESEARPAPAGSAGLYHLAFEMPTRKDLARWVVHAATFHFQVTGLADHQVTESVYLNDPEGNGIEIYADRSEEQWKWNDGEVAMGVFDLDLEPILELVDRNKDDYSVAPARMRIGHIHLRVGDLGIAEAFYSGLLGFEVTRRAPGVVFMSSGRYHHHVAVNIWDIPEAGQRGERELGLSWFSIAVTDRAISEDRKARLRVAGVSIWEIAERWEIDDPWGNRIRFVIV
ncbi:VOC family protein [Agrobacterium sp. LMR679]|uniref:VOC family protein n=1 Tax=Agrobacterium sp. LMR679 TaxID=3014335 RepID=UPI0022AF8B32|nr:VOC family protein [Agrobacterium sp. LMR679]MCZ4072131.1 VOC family protein [Agrobacterium sp. LMR679]